MHNNNLNYLNIKTNDFTGKNLFSQNSKSIEDLGNDDNINIMKNYDNKNCKINKENNKDNDKQFNSI